MALGDRAYVFDGSPRWTPKYALGVVTHHAITAAEVQDTAVALRAAMETAPRGWVIDRLTVLATMFSIGRVPAAASDLTVWLAEGARLLADIPHDILGSAIDQAVKTRSHGFMPSIGEIRAIAEPAIEERSTQLQRLEVLGSAMEAH